MSDWQGGAYEPRGKESPAQQLLRHAKVSPQGDTGKPGSSDGESAVTPSDVTGFTGSAGVQQTTDGTSPANPLNTGTSLAELSTPSTGFEVPKATEGWRGRTNRWSLGLVKLSAGPVERRRLEDEHDAGTQLSRPMTVMVANIKGAAGKTPTAAMLSALLGKHRGGGVVAWDNNENQGTLGDRTQEGRFPTTAVDLLESLDQFEEGRGRVGNMGRFVRHQQVGPFDVLASANDARVSEQIGAEEFARLHAVLTTFYPLLVVDTGNAVAAPNWTATAAQADVLVIPVRWSYDHVRSAERMIEVLRSSGRASLVERAITVVSHAGGSADRASSSLWREWFEENTAQVLDVPYDPHIDAGTQLRFDRLAPATQRAYLSLGASVSRTLAALDNPFVTH